MRVVPWIPLVIAALLAGALACARGERPKTRKPPPKPLVEQMPPVDPAKTIEGRLLVAGMHCSACEYNVSTALKLVPGVLEAEADRASGVAIARYDPSMTTLEQLAQAVRTTGYVVAPTAESAGK